MVEGVSLAAQQTGVVGLANDRHDCIVAANPVSAAAWLAGDSETCRAIDIDVVDHDVTPAR
jgi:hypothetical protein